MILNNSNIKNKLKYKIISHFMTKGNKITCENILSKSLKLIQKSKNKSHSEILKLAILNVTPAFRIMELQEKRKKKRKKGTKRAKEIPAFLSHYIFRTSWALKFIASTVKKSPNKFSDQFKQEILLTAQNTGESIKTKTEIQKQALKKKFSFKYYRW
jgi:ribosomal protein S7